MVSQLLSLLFSLGLLLLLPAATQPTAIQELYVKPTEDTSCPEPCHTLDEYVQHTTQYFVSNTAFKFLPGDHDLGQFLNVNGISNLAMVAHSNGSSVKISCSDVPFSFGFKFYNLSFTGIANLSLEDIAFSNCILGLADIVNLSLLRVSMEPPDLASLPILSANNILGTSIITGLGINSPSSGSAISVYFSDSNFNWPLPGHNKLTIKDSDISFLSDFGLNIATNLLQSTYNVSFLLENVTVTSNGHPIFIMDIRSTAYNTVTVQSLQSTQATAVFSVKDYTTSSNTVVHVGDCLSLTVRFFLISTQLTFEDSSVYLRSSDIPVFDASSPFDATGRDLTIKNVTFSNLKSSYILNHANLDIKPSDSEGLVRISSGKNISFIDCKFLSNNGRRATSALGLPIISLTNSRDISFTNCDFSNNIGTAIFAFDSSYTLSGSNTFSNNTAYRGGAVAFYRQSYVTFSDGSNTVFVNNSADTVGGAIYVDYGLNYPCFFQDVACHSSVPPIKLRFEGNKAEIGGERVYGASLDTCSGSSGCSGQEFASNVLNFDPRNTTDFSAIASDPLRVCLCEDGRPSCTTVFSNHTHYPGETFNISAVVVGDRFGTVDGSVYAQLLPVSGRPAVLGSLQSSQRVEHSQCTNVSYTVFSSGSTATMTLTASNTQTQEYPNENEISNVCTATKFYNNDGSITPTLGTYPVYINITLLPCPLGFMLSGQPHGCICDTPLQNNHIPCDLSTQTVRRSGTEWVNASFHGNSSTGVIVSKYCPNDYCRPETVDVNLEYPDTQCAFNRSGILCGGCQSGRSLALGSPQCLHCSNDYLTLLIPFALAGFVLVFFIKLLNLTVAQGMLNGLIFYANIVRAYQVTWIPGHKENVLTVFIAWLNLDLGIETCFIDGLDAYWMTWLQFVFPIYFWGIAISIIILSHYFTTAAKVFGCNSVQTLATLFLLSYSKLLRTIISIFQFSTFDTPEGTSETRWSYDGNIPYLSPKLVPLFLTAATAVLFLWLPYTLILLFAQCLQRSSNYRVGKVLAKLKPFLDAYFGPLRDKHRYWVGLLLLVRGILFISFAATPPKNSEVALLLVLITVLCIMAYLAHVGGVYKKNYLSLLEISFFLNLAILAAGTLYAGTVESALAYTSVGIAFAQFVVIVIVHSIVCLKKTRLVHKLCQMVKPTKTHVSDETDEHDTLVEEPVTNKEGPLQMVVSYSNFREPVLKYLD